MTIHRQIFGKKYPGGGQKIQEVRGPEGKSTAKASGSGTKKVAAVILKQSRKTEELAEEAMVSRTKEKEVERGPKRNAPQQKLEVKVRQKVRK